MTSGSHLKFLQIIQVAQTCPFGNQARFVLEPLYSTKQQKHIIVHDISRFWKFQIDYMPPKFFLKLGA